MGGIGQLFGGGAYSTPDLAETPAMPVRAEHDPEEKDTRDIERRKLRARANGINGTLLRNSLGNTGGNRTLLGGATSAGAGNGQQS